MMLDWLTSRSQKADHPMHSVEEAQRLLSGLSDEPLQALDEITSWLNTIAQAAGFPTETRIAVTQLVDETGQPFEPLLTCACLAPRGNTEFVRMQMWRTALQFWEHVEHAYRVCIDELQQTPKPQRSRVDDFPVLTARLLRALAQQFRLRRLRYLPVPETSWQALFDIYRASEDAACDNQRVTAYPDDKVPTTARQELLRAVMLDIARPDSMLPHQTEIAARIVARYADAFLFDTAPKAGCNWTVDVAAARPPELATGVATLRPTARFFGAGGVIVKIEEVIRRLIAEPAAREQRFGEEYTAHDKLAVLQRLTGYWGPRPPHRSEKRETVGATVEVATGFDIACRQLPRAYFRDWSKLLGTLDPALVTRLGINTAPASVPAPEPWDQHDASTWGMGAQMPRAREANVTIGTLCVIGSGDQPSYVGVVRRLYRDSEDRMNAGIEVLARKPALILLRRVGRGGPSVQAPAKVPIATGNDYLNAILLGASRAERQRHEMLVARGGFTAGTVCEAMLGDDRQLFRLEDLLEQGADFDRVRFTRIKNAQPAGGTPVKTPT